MKMRPSNPFVQRVIAVQHRITRMQRQAARVLELCDTDDAAVYDAALRLEEQSERTVFLTRQLPMYLGRPTAKADTEQAMLSAVPLEIGFTEEGWFRMVIPTILPKKERGNKDYYRGLLYPAMQRYFYGREPVRFSPCIIIYRHIYTADRPERRMRDHDNIEINMVTDIVALYTMPDDAPGCCSHFYCSALGSSDCTEVYVVPSGDFPQWLATHTFG